MRNDDLLKYIKLWLPELNSVQVDRLRKEFKRVEVEARLDELDRYQTNTWGRDIYYSSDLLGERIEALKAEL